MEILTTDKRKLFIRRIGKPDNEALTSSIECLDKNGKKHVITWQDVEGAWGSISFSPIDGIKPARED